MGIFEVSEANRTLRCIEIMAYGYMLRFEEDFNGFQSTGTAYNFINALLTPYMATISNLSSAVGKTSDMTMKITYTLTETE